MSMPIEHSLDITLFLIALDINTNMHELYDLYKKNDVLKGDNTFAVYELHFLDGTKAFKLISFEHCPEELMCFTLDVLGHHITSEQQVSHLHLIQSDTFTNDVCVVDVSA